MIIGSKNFNLENDIYIMGILNVTPDSFSDGGKWNDMDRALRHTEEMIKNHAAIIDIGGESTRPGYTKISDDEEIERIVPYIEKITRRFDVPVSVDTYKSKVARAAVEAGASMINDIWGFKADEDMARVAARTNVACCIMHNRDEKKNPYRNLMCDVLGDLQESIDIGLAAGVNMSRMITDPGIGFGKTYEENLYVLKHLDMLSELGCPVLLGTSRKSVIGLTLDTGCDERLEGTLATSVIGAMSGCSIIRVHDVLENYRAIEMTKAVLRAVRKP